MHGIFIYCARNVHAYMECTNGVYEMSCMEGTNSVQEIYMKRNVHVYVECRYSVHELYFGYGEMIMCFILQLMPAVSWIMLTHTIVSIGLHLCNGPIFILNLECARVIET